MSSRYVALMLGAGFMLYAGAARAEITPPVLVSDPGVAYPDQALAEHVTETVVVSLTLTIDAEGAVVDATVKEPVGHGFDETAISSAKAIIFEPARRDGKAIPSRITFQYTFIPPAPLLSGRVVGKLDETPVAGVTVSARDSAGNEAQTVSDADGAWSFRGLVSGAVSVALVTPAGESVVLDDTLEPGQETVMLVRVAQTVEPVVEPASAEAVEDISVHGERPPREVTKRTLVKEEIERIPGTNGDALRSLQNLPGVARSPPLSGALIVRGSAPEATNIFFDGTNVPLVYHFGGLSSVMPSEVLERIDFFPGNYSAYYGRGMGGIVDAGLRAPKSDALHVIAQADLIDTRLLIEGPLGNTGWTFLVAGRRSWFDVWLTPILESSGTAISSAPVYYDYQAMLQKQVTPTSSFRVLFFGSDDRIRVVNQGSSDVTYSGDISSHIDFWRLQLRYDNALSERTHLRAIAAYGRDGLDVTLGPRFGITTTRPLSARLEVSHDFDTLVRAHVGLDFLYAPYDLNLRLAPARRPGAPDTGPFDVPVLSRSSNHFLRPAVYTELEVTPSSATRIVPGLRVDYDNRTDRWNVAPRLSVRHDLDSDFPRTTLKGAIGLFYQPPDARELDPVSGTEPLIPSRAMHIDVGVERQLTEHIDLIFDGYYRRSSNLIVRGAGNIATGDAFGAETFLRYNTDGRFFGWVSYSLQRSTILDDPAVGEHLSEYDQTHVLTIIGSYKLGNNWQIGGRFRFTSGSLETPRAYGAFDSASGTPLESVGYPPFGRRLPAFHQLDIRVDKSWNVAGLKLSAYLDLWNAYNAHQVTGSSYNYNYTRRTRAYGLPILPSVGFRGEF